MIQTFSTFPSFLAALLAVGGSTDAQTSASGRYPQGGPSSLKPDVVISASINVGGECHVLESPPRDWSTEGLRLADINELAEKGGAIFNDATPLQRLSAQAAIAKIVFNPARLRGITSRKFFLGRVQPNGKASLVSRASLKFLDRAGNDDLPKIVTARFCDIYLTDSSMLSPDMVIFKVGVLTYWLSLNEAAEFASIEDACQKCYRWTGFQIELAELVS